MQYALHFWLGAETSQDESGCCAYKTQELHHNALSGGTIVEYREVEGSESAKFLALFKDMGGIQYLPGGMESGFSHVERDVWPTRLLHIKGQRTVRVKEVPVSSASLNSGDVFILDQGLMLYIFNGPTANKFEKAKGLEVLNGIKNDNRGGRAEIVIVNEDLQNEEFWSALGGYVDPSSLPAGDSDDSVLAKLPNRLVHISDASGTLEQREIQLEGGALKKAQLDSSDVFIILASEKVYVWVGRKSTPQEKKEATMLAMKFIASEGLPASTPIERVSDGMESSAFKAEFAAWDPPMTPKQLAANYQPTPDDPIDIAALLARQAASEKSVVADPGSENVRVWVIENFDKVEVPKEKHGQFYGGDSYIIAYTYQKSRKNACMLYFWLGRDSTADEMGTAALLTKQMDEVEYGGDAVQVRITQGKEPAHFRSIFGGKLIIHSGGKGSSFRNAAASDSYDTDGIALFHVRGSTPVNTTTVQVSEVATSLNGADCFVLVSPSTVYAWNGSDANPEEISTALTIAQILGEDFLGRGGRTVESVNEGSENDDFWALLGGRAEYSRSGAGADLPRSPRLFQASNATGKFRLDEVEQFDQTDLNDEDVFLLDTYTQIFVWMGSKSNKEEQDKGMLMAQEFISTASDGRDPSMPIVTIAAGNEPDMFTTYFLPWDPEYVTKHMFKDPYQAKLEQAKQENKEVVERRMVTLKASVAPPAPVVEEKKPDWAKPVEAEAETPPPAPSPAKAAPAASGTIFPYEVLKAGLPDGVDPAFKEKFLDEATFKQLFNTDLATFSAMPKWKRDEQKKKVGLF